MAHAADLTPSQDRCAAAYEQTQRARKAGMLQQALSEAIACAQSSCAKLLQVDCSQWMDELREALPTVVVDVRTADDREVPNAEVFVDEQLLDSALRGRAITLDPGVHKLRVEASGQTIRQSFVAVEGRKNQVVAVRLAAPERRTEPSATVGASGKSDPQMSSRQKTALALAVVATAATVSWGYFGLSGLSRRNELERDCGGFCDVEGRESIETKFLVADLSLLVAAVSGGAAAWLWWGESKPDVASALPRLQASATSRSAWLGLTGTF